MIRISNTLLQSSLPSKRYVQKMCQVAAINVVAKWKQKFTEEKIEDSDFSIKCIMSHVLSVEFASLHNYNVHTLTTEQKEQFDKFCECRLARMPIQYIVGSWDFRGISLRMLPPVFIPRPETEQLVDLVLQSPSASDKREFLEIGCGSGPICCSLLRELPLTTGVTLDSNRLACNLTKLNAENSGVDNRLTIIHHKVTEEQVLPDILDSRTFDFIVSNPPYVKSKDIMKLESEIKLYEDLRALDGGPDGMAIVRVLLRIADKKLKKGGRMWLEVDGAQISLIRTILQEKFNYSLKMLNSYKDMFKRERFVEIEKL